jgi:hypothetical protein
VLHRCLLCCMRARALGAGGVERRARQPASKRAEAGVPASAGDTGDELARRLGLGPGAWRQAAKAGGSRTACTGRCTRGGDAGGSWRGLRMTRVSAGLSGHGRERQARTAIEAGQRACRPATKRAANFWTEFGEERRGKEGFWVGIFGVKEGDLRSDLGARVWGGGRRGESCP